MSKKILLKILAYLFLLLFVTHQSITVFHTHGHNIHGFMVVHSHPFNKAFGSEHTHTLYGFHLIQTGMINMIIF